jgi:LEA14-like dessication related protein
VRFIVFALCIVLSACSGPKEPYFVKLEKPIVSQGSPSNIQVDAKAIYHNPNPFGAELTKTHFDVFIEGKKVTTVDQDKLIEIPAEADFIIPVSFKFSTMELFKKDGFLKGLLGKAIENELEVRYQGYVVVKLMAIELEIPFTYSEKISLGVNYEEST